MKNNLKLGSAVVGAMLASASLAHAGGIERSASPYAILWEKGNYVELSFGRVSPDISGTSPLSGTASSGDMTDAYTQAGLGVKYAINNEFDVAVVFDQPVGANLTYPTGTGYIIAGTTASIDSNAISVLGRYKLQDGWSVHGGVKVQRSKGEVSLPIYSYKMHTSTETDLGYLIGAAYERPDIALRVALTYQSAITHKFTGNETGGLGDANDIFETEVPQSLTLDFQTGVAADTLLFGSVRWRDWSEFSIKPSKYTAVDADGLVSYPKDTVTWSLGLGRKFTDNFSAAVSVGYEDKMGAKTGNLGPHDGMKSITLGGTYTHENMKVTAGVSYIKIGDATTKSPVSGTFGGNKGVGVGVKVGYSF